MNIEIITFVKNGDASEEKVIDITDELLEILISRYLKDNFPHLSLEDWVVSRVSLD